MTIFVTCYQPVPMNYQRLGDHIREVNIRNRELRVTAPMGINIDKYFMPSVANVIGTDLSNYKLVSQLQFACNLMHVGRDEKIPMAMLTDEAPIIVSPAYFVFEVSKPEILLPDYLMMWFRRPEFDRNAWFYTDSDVRGGMSKVALLDMRLPVPPIERQREIVAEYETLNRRIRLNEQIIQRLEATAQALYRNTFVDNIDKQNLPPGWHLTPLGEFVESFSKTHQFSKDKLIFLNTSDILSGKILSHTYSDVASMPGQAKKIIKNGDILFSEIRPANKRYALVKEQYPEDFVVSTKLMVLRMKNNDYSNLKVFFYLTLPEVLDDLQKQADGASGTFPQITFDGNLKNLNILIGDPHTEKEWGEFLTIYYESKWNKENEIEKLTELQSLLLAKMGQ